MDGVVDSLWYVLDEFGSRIRHHGDANFRMVPFFCQFWGYSVSLLFPRRNVAAMSEVWGPKFQIPDVYIQWGPFLYFQNCVGNLSWNLLEGPIQDYEGFKR